MGLSWAAGFYSGEGCTYVNSSKGGPYIRLEVCQKDRRALDTFARIVGLGKISGPKKRQEIYTWYAQGKKALAVLDLLWFALSDQKREQAKKVVEAVESN